MDIESKSKLELVAVLEALDHVQAIIWFEPDGTIIEANEIFCNATGYRLDEIVGKHHRMFCEAEFANSPEYTSLWEGLRRGETASGKYKRINKEGKPIYIRASYNPIRDDNGQVVKVVKFALDVTHAINREALVLSKLDAITRALAVIEFEIDGSVRWANDNFLNAMGYTLDEIKGKHHRMFVDPSFAASPEYTALWQKLQAGDYELGEFQRFGKNGKEVWINAGYNPIKDPEGKVYRVLKYATDITASKLATRHISKGLNALSQGDLSFRLPDEMVGEFAALRIAYNETMVRLEELVKGILGASNGIADESGSIAATSNDLSARCEQQAATVEETSAAMEEMSATVQSNTSNAKNATEAARTARKHAENGGQVVGDAISAMERIKNGSTEIGKIISVIDSIAFQTNLLALNAGVEAARAGDAGRGFAVVASEVRALAQRASDSARDINTLIESSSQEVAEGASLVSKTGEVLSEIVESVSSVSEAIESIFTAGTEQAAGVTEVNQAISSIDTSTQKTAAIAEESAAAAATLANSAADLQGLVGFFGDGDGTPDAARAPSRPAQHHQREKVAVNAPPKASAPVDDSGWESF